MVESLKTFNFRHKSDFGCISYVPPQFLPNLLILKVWVIYIMILRTVNDASMKKSALFFTLKYNRSAENSKKKNPRLMKSTVFKDLISRRDLSFEDFLEFSFFTSP